LGCLQSKQGYQCCHAYIYALDSGGNTASINLQNVGIPHESVMATVLGTQEPAASTSLSACKATAVGATALLVKLLQACRQTAGHLFDLLLLCMRCCCPTTRFDREDIHSEIVVNAA
jgi:hypothetical protein